jgi:hypothetical protein
MYDSMAAKGAKKLVSGPSPVLPLQEQNWRMPKIDAVPAVLQPPEN